MRQKVSAGRKRLAARREKKLKALDEQCRLAMRRFEEDWKRERVVKKRERQQAWVSGLEQQRVALEPSTTAIDTLQLQVINLEMQVDPFLKKAKQRQTSVLSRRALLSRSQSTMAKPVSPPEAQKLSHWRGRTVGPALTFGSWRRPAQVPAPSKSHAPVPIEREISVTESDLGWGSASASDFDGGSFNISGSPSFCSFW